MYCRQSNNVLRQTKIKKIFNDLAEDYWLNNIFSFGLTAYIRKQAIDKLKIKQNESVLDIMCGTGDNFKYLFRFTNHITALDYSENMLSVARASNKYSKSVHLVKKDFLSDDISELKFNNCLCTFGLKQLQDDEIPIFVHQLRTVLCAQGRFCMAEICLDNRSFSSRMALNYMHYFLPIINKLITGKNHHKYLYSFAKNTVPVQYIIQILQENNFEVDTDFIAFKHAVVISGKYLG
ncbi:MAG TPA: class I SAM-dependent methyltransferase [Chitinophagales bacterium]|nr:class I SAM-dependent methyltransferase [Chitinophagales bacterium]